MQQSMQERGVFFMLSLLQCPNHAHTHTRAQPCPTDPAENGEIHGRKIAQFMTWQQQRDKQTGGCQKSTKRIFNWIRSRRSCWPCVASGKGNWESALVCCRTMSMNCEDCALLVGANDLPVLLCVSSWKKDACKRTPHSCRERVRGPRPFQRPWE